MENIYYHVISDIPKKEGEHILLDEDHPNGVHKRVYEQLETVEDIYRNPDKYKDTELSHVVDVALRELALEKVRKEKYPQYPSRMASLYVSKTFEEAERWGEYFAKLGRPTYGIAKIKVSGRYYEGAVCRNRFFDLFQKISVRVSEAEGSAREIPVKRSLGYFDLLARRQII